MVCSGHRVTNSTTGKTFTVCFKSKLFGELPHISGQINKLAKEMFKAMIDAGFKILDWTSVRKYRVHHVSTGGLGL